MRLFDLFVNKLSDVTYDIMDEFIQNHRHGEFQNVDLDEFDNAIKRLKTNIKSNSRIYRAVSVFGDPVFQVSNAPNIGVSWTYDLNTADVYRTQHGNFGEKVILVSPIDSKKIDWIKTVALHMIPVRGRYEREIRLKTHTNIKISEILDKDGKSIHKKIITRST